MLDSAKSRGEKLQSISEDRSLDDKQRERELEKYRRQVKREIGKEGRFHLPPRGFSIEGAKELFRMTGNLVDSE